MVTNLMGYVLLTANLVLLTPVSSCSFIILERVSVSAELWAKYHERLSHSSLDHLLKLINVYKEWIFSFCCYQPWIILRHGRTVWGWIGNKTGMGQTYESVDDILYQIRPILKRCKRSFFNYSRAIKLKKHDSHHKAGSLPPISEWMF